AEAPPPKAPPAIRHPIDDARVNAAQNDDRGLPQLGESDALVRDALAKLQGASAFERFFHPQDIVRRFVATIDNLPRRSVAPQVTVVKPVPGAFHIAGNEGALTIGGDNAARYTPYVRFAQAIDTKTLVALYVRFYPWF